MTAPSRSSGCLRNCTPNIDIVYEFGGFNRLTKMSTQAAAAICPTSCSRTTPGSANGQCGLLMPLDDFYRRRHAGFSNVSDSELAGGRIDGKLYAVAWVPTPRPSRLTWMRFNWAGAHSWTWEEFEQIVLQHDELGIWGFVLGDERSGRPSTWATGNGATAKGTAIGYE